MRRMGMACHDGSRLCRQRIRLFGKVDNIPFLAFQFIRVVGCGRANRMSVWLCSVSFRGASADGLRDISDPIRILRWQFLGAAAPPCMEAANMNDDAMVDMSDAIYILNWLFRGGSEPPAPYPDCGPDPDPRNSIGCDWFDICRDL